MQVALIRGINVGRAKRVPMAELREALAGEGFAAVRTLLNSGNVVWESPGGSARHNAAVVERVIEERFGISARVIGLGSRDLAAIVDENPHAAIADDPSRLMVSVWSGAEARTDLEPLLEEDWGAERFGLGSRAAYLWCSAGILDSPLNEAVSKRLGDRVTTRNWRTVLRIHALACG